MSYDILRHAKTLELDRVLEMLSAEASLPDAKAAAIELKPQNDINTARAALKDTEEAYKLIAGHSSPAFGMSNDVSPALTRAQVGATLSIKELLEVASILKVIRNVKKWRDDCAVADLAIDRYFVALAPNKYLEDKITFAIKSEDELQDNASPLLADIRRKIASRSSKIRDDLDKIIKGQTAKYLQDAIITQRDGRFVVPVRSEHRGDIKGIVHDTSSSGSTFFIEPMSVVETNNEIRVLRIKEQDEIARILAELSSETAGFADNIRYSYKALVELCLIFAKASLAFKMKAVVPKLNDTGYVYFKNARHPLISPRTVVPITVSLGREYDSLVITGPNTGGKTVTLKTVGLLSLMAMCGLMIPADDSSEAAIFSRIFADIGDEQSIEQSLSTFSSHMVNIISILDECDDNSLVLFDELCAGTDPVEGAALAKAILIRLTNLCVKTVATTHYPELKAYALDTPRVENASCEFDVTTLKPTYRLIIGVPGRSNAFSISGRLGLSEDLIELAREQVSADDMRFERVVASLEAARQSAEEEHRQAVRLKSELEATKKRFDNREHEFRIKQDKLMEQTREKANRIIEDARYKSGLLLNELEEMKKQLNAENAAKLIENARTGYKKTLKELEDAADPVTASRDTGEKLRGVPKSGDIVVISSFGRDATVIEVNEKNKKAFVMSGSMKMWIAFDDLRIKKGSQSTEIKKTRNITGLASREKRSTSGEIDIRGMASDEAILELDKYIDNAVLSGITTITVIHGKGTGVLRKAVHTHLRSHKNIKTFRIGLFGEGENGVTIAELNE